jgi:hypothetical protein
MLLRHFLRAAHCLSQGGTFMQLLQQQFPAFPVIVHCIIYLSVRLSGIDHTGCYFIGKP